MRKYDLAIEKYWVTQSGYFRLATKVILGMGITDGEILLCHGISEGVVEKKFSTIYYNNRTVYYYFKDPFPTDFGSPYLNPPPINIDDSPYPDKRDRCIHDFLPDAISAASENSISNLTTPSDTPKVLVLTSNDLNPHNTTKKD